MLLFPFQKEQCLHFKANSLDSNFLWLHKSEEFAIPPSQKYFKMPEWSGVQQYTTTIPAYILPHSLESYLWNSRKFWNESLKPTAPCHDGTSLQQFCSFAVKNCVDRECIYLFKIKNEINAVSEWDWKQFYRMSNTQNGLSSKTQWKIKGTRITELDIESTDSHLAKGSSGQKKIINKIKNWKGSHS